MKFKDGHTYRIFGVLVGSIWQPGFNSVTKDFEVKFATEQQPFVKQADNLEQALGHILNDGDFRFCRILWALLEDTWYRTNSFGNNVATTEAIKLDIGNAEDIDNPSEYFAEAENEQV